MSQIASKNLYDLLGNDPELDPDREPEPPTKVADKPVARTGKRNAGAEAPASASAPQRQDGGEGGRGRGRGGRGDGGMRSRGNEDGVRPDRHPRAMRGEHRGGGERGRGRGGRGYSGRYTRTNRDDRGDHTGHGDHEKQAAHGWGEEKDGNAEWNDERAGDAIARAESKDEPGFTPDTSAGDPAFTNGPGAEGEVVGEDAVAPPEEDKTKSYDQYLAEQAEKRLALGDNSLQTRKANEGSKQKFPEGTAVERNPEQENFFIGGGGKARREKASGREKNTLNLDGQYYKDPDSSERGGGRGRGRGRGRGGEGRGDRGGERGAGGRGGRGRGEFRGGPRGDRGDRGGPGGPRGAINTSDQSAFPALGGS